MAQDKLHTFVISAKIDDVRRLMNAYGTTDTNELFQTLIKFELQRLRFRPAAGDQSAGEKTQNRT